MLPDVFPKVLFIADEIPQSVNAGSIQFYRIFKGYPTDRIMIMGKKPTKYAQLLDCPYFELDYPLSERLRLSRFTSLLSDIQAVGLLLKTLPCKLQKIANDFKPDVIVSLMQHITYYYPAYAYAKKKQLPLILFCHDDAEEFARAHPSFKGLLTKRNAEIYSYSKKRLCISPEMATKWKEKYGVEGDFLYPLASPDLLPRSADDSRILKNNPSFTIGYAGSLAYGYNEGIAEIIPVLEKVNAKLIIYRDKDHLAFDSENIRYAGYSSTPEQTWSKIKTECDAVILPYSSKQEFKQLYTTHFPSKISEYISLGMPIIINGPQYANGIKWANTQKGITVSNSSTLFEIISSLKLNSATRIESVNLIKNIPGFNQNDILIKFKSFLTYNERS